MSRRFIIPLGEVLRAEESAAGSNMKARNGQPTWPAQTRFVAGLDGKPAPRSLIGQGPILFTRKAVEKKT